MRLRSSIAALCIAACLSGSLAVTSSSPASAAKKKSVQAPTNISEVYGAYNRNGDLGVTVRWAHVRGIDRYRLWFFHYDYKSRLPWKDVDDQFFVAEHRTTFVLPNTWFPYSPAHKAMPWKVLIQSLSPDTAKANNSPYHAPGAVLSLTPYELNHHVTLPPKPTSGQKSAAESKLHSCNNQALTAMTVTLVAGVATAILVSWFPVDEIPVAGATAIATAAGGAGVWIVCMATRDAGRRSRAPVAALRGLQ